MAPFPPPPRAAAAPMPPFPRPCRRAADAADADAVGAKYLPPGMLAS
jgi:hypothetical protein